jgi:flavin-dependent dehydrogenase
MITKEDRENIVPRLPLDEQPYFEVLVCGGGPAGVAAVTTAAEAGRSTLLIERFGRLGGMGTNAMVNQIVQWTQTPYVRKLHGKIAPRQNDSEFLDLLYADLVAESGAKLLLHSTVFDVMMALNGRKQMVKGVRLATPSGPLEILAKRVIDATGDGMLAFLAGAEFEMGRESDDLVQPASNHNGFGRRRLRHLAFCGERKLQRTTKVTPRLKAERQA